MNEVDAIPWMVFIGVWLLALCLLAYALEHWVDPNDDRPW